MKYITTGKAARICGVGVNTIKRWIQRGELKAVITPGGHWRIVESEFQHFLERMQFEPAELATPYKVLLIEDDLPLCSLIEGAFDLASFETAFDCAHDGYAGLMKIGSMQPDLIVLDIMLPEINGLELMQRVRIMEFSRHARILVITGAGDRRLVKKALEKAQPDALLLKPFNVAELIDSAHKLLEDVSSSRATS